MSSFHQLRGALLEDVILILLQSSGYVPVIAPGSDPTLRLGAAGMSVQGRGGQHQIDAIADFSIPLPFSHRQRLLVEAKAHSRGKKVDLSVIRNSVGVLKDVNEYWNVDRPAAIASGRYHYRSAVFTSTGFTEPAQNYAFAQDIYLLPLSRSSFFAPILKALDQVAADAVDEPTPMGIRVLRMGFRRAMGLTPADTGGLPADRSLGPLIRACKEIGSSLLGMIAEQFPVFLVPESPKVLDNLRDQEEVRIYYDKEGWYLGRPEPDRHYLFSFDLPYQLFELYAEDGQLSASAAADLKGKHLKVISAFHIRDGRPRVVTFTLDRRWLIDVRRQIQITQDREERHRQRRGENQG